MYVIALSSIPPRLPRLAPVLTRLLAQRPAPARVLLCLPRTWRRFPGAVNLPALPEGVEVVTVPEDYGPATKALGAAPLLAGRIGRLIYCDDDWLMPPGWAAALLGAQRAGEAVAATGYGVTRLRRQGTAREGFADVAQGYSGVLVDPAWLCRPDIAPPQAARAVDDIWLSGQLARQGVPIRLAPAAREGLAPAYEDAHGLQDTPVGGLSRNEANLACADLLTRRYGIWPERECRALGRKARRQGGGGTGRSPATARAARR